MCIHIYIYIYIYICKHTHTYMYTHTQTHTYTNICIHIFVYVYGCAYVNVYAWSMYTLLQAPADGVKPGSYEKSHLEKCHTPATDKCQGERRHRTTQENNAHPCWDAIISSVCVSAAPQPVSVLFSRGWGAANSGVPMQSPSERGASTETNRCLAKGEFGTCSVLWWTQRCLYLPLMAKEDLGTFRDLRKVTF